MGDVSVILAQIACEISWLQDIRDIRAAYLYDGAGQITMLSDVGRSRPGSELSACLSRQVNHMQSQKGKKVLNKLIDLEIKTIIFSSKAGNIIVILLAACFFAVICWNIPDRRWLVIFTAVLIIWERILILKIKELKNHQMTEKVRISPPSRSD
ncbi:hypothetical protein [Erwinia sp. B116]|uniref:hypothetical protein n=1 Tax=Erwinia sp. B116 TaxID=1561024 RepID=UPI0011AFC185|nr:hypothetical protein [Erwinia sp. B116]